MPLSYQMFECRHQHDYTVQESTLSQVTAVSQTQPSYHVGNGYADDGSGSAGKSSPVRTLWDFYSSSTHVRHDAVLCQARRVAL